MQIQFIAIFCLCFMIVNCHDVEGEKILLCSEAQEASFAKLAQASEDEEKHIPKKSENKKILIAQSVVADTKELNNEVILFTETFGKNGQCRLRETTQHQESIVRWTETEDGLEVEFNPKKSAEESR